MTLATSAGGLRGASGYADFLADLAADLMKSRDDSMLFAQTAQILAPEPLPLLRRLTSMAIFASGSGSNRPTDGHISNNRPSCEAALMRFIRGGWNCVVMS